MSVTNYFNKIEKIIEKRFKKVKIISEVHFTYEEFTKVKENLSKVFKKYEENQESVITQFWILAPKTALLMTVQHAIYYYDGNFWGRFKQDFNLVDDKLWKIKFLKQLEIERLAKFKGGQKYISNILGHAGIPKNNISSFIKGVLHPAILHGLNADEVLNTFKYEGTVSGISKNHLYKSVRDFMNLEGEVSRNILERCIEVWSEQDRPFIENYQGYLPDHFLVEFDNFASNENITKTLYQNKVERPFLYYSPDYQNIYIKLPQQRYSSNQYSTVHWEIETDTKKYRVETYKVIHDNGDFGFLPRSKNGEFSINPYDMYSVKIFTDGEQNGDWSFQINEFAVFNRNNYEQINKKTISLKELIFIVNDYSKKEIENTENINYTIYPLQGEWKKFYELDTYIDNPTIIKLGNDGIVIQPNRRLMQLNGDQFPNIQGLYPIFQSNIQIQFDTNFLKISKNLSNWKIKLQLPALNKIKYKLLSDCEVIFIENNQILVNLDKLIGEIGRESGLYKLTLTGMLGRDETLEFYYVPDEHLNISKIENEIYFKTHPKLSLHLVEGLSSESIATNKKMLKVSNNFSTIQLNLVNQNTKEQMSIKYFPNLIGVKLKTEGNTLPIGEFFEKTYFNFKDTEILIDLENPTLHVNKSSIEIIIYERLQNGQYAEKSFNCRVNRKHRLDLSFFESLQNTFSKRIIFIRIPTLQIETVLLTINTSWSINSISVRNNDKLEWELTFPVNNVKVRIWGFDFVKPLILEKVIDTTINKQILDISHIPSGYYIFEIEEYLKDDFFSFLDQPTFPKNFTNHHQLIKFENQKRLSSFAKIVLIENEYADEGEWQEEQLIKLFEFIFNCKNISLPLLIEDYNSCFDFGIVNIDNILSIVDNDINKDLRSFIASITVCHEWDFESFAKMIDIKSVSNQYEMIYIPNNFNELFNYSRAERIWSYNNSKNSQTILKGFDLKGEYLRFLDDLESNYSMELKLNKYINTYKQTIDDILYRYKMLGLISKNNESILKCRFRDNVLDVYNFPYYLGTVAYLSAMTFYAESRMEENDLIFIRQAILQLFKLDSRWLLHDLVFWKTTLKKQEEYERTIEERKKQYGNPSFAWKK